MFEIVKVYNVSKLQRYWDYEIIICGKFSVGSFKTENAKIY